MAATKTNRTAKRPKKLRRTRKPHIHIWESYKPLGALPEELSAFDDDDVVCLVCDLLHRHRWRPWGSDPHFARCVDPDCGEMTDKHPG